MKVLKRRRIIESFSSSFLCAAQGSEDGRLNSESDSSEETEIRAFSSVLCVDGGAEDGRFNQWDDDSENDNSEETEIRALSSRLLCSDGGAEEGRFNEWMDDRESDNSLNSEIRSLFDYDSDITDDDDVVESERFSLNNATEDCERVKDSTDYLLLAYVNFAIAEGCSAGTLKRMDALMCLLYGHPPPVNAKQAQNWINKSKNRHIRSVKYFCNLCGKHKQYKREMCVECGRKSLTSLGTATFIETFCEKQLQMFLKKKGSAIIDAHERIRAGSANFEPHDIRRFPGYQGLIEDNSEYEEGKVNLICTLSSDGARLKRLSRREATPILLRLEGLDLADKASGSSMVIIGIVFADGGVKKHLIDDFVKLAVSRVSTMTVSVTLSGRFFEFRMTILSYLADMKEQYALTKLPNWNQLQGCSKCLTTGNKKKSGKVSYNDFTANHSRNDHSIITSSQNATHGFTETCLPVIFNFVAPTKFSVDPFHVRSLGVCKDVVSEFDKRFKWKSLKLLRGKREEISEAIDSVKGYTYDPTVLQSLKKTGKCTGREIDKLSVFVTALAGWTESFASRDFQVFFLGLYHSLTFLGSLLATPGAILDLLDAMYKLHVFLEPDSLSIKWHTFYKHVHEHEQQFGPQHSTETYEREHKTLMTSVNHQSTNCEYEILTRYIAQKECILEMNRLKDLLSPDIVDCLIQSQKPNARGRLPVLNNGACNIIERIALKPEHLSIINQLQLSAECTFRKREKYTSRMGSFVVSAQSYWKCDFTDQSCISWVDPIENNIRFGYCEMLFKNPDNASFVVAREFTTESFRGTLSFLYDSTLSPISAKVLELCTNFPTTFAKFIDTSLSLVPLDCVLAPAYVIKTETSSFVKMYR